MRHVCKWKSYLKTPYPACYTHTQHVWVYSTQCFLSTSTYIVWNFYNVCGDNSSMFEPRGVEYMLGRGIARRMMFWCIFLHLHTYHIILHIILFILLFCNFCLYYNAIHCSLKLETGLVSETSSEKPLKLFPLADSC